MAVTIDSTCIIKWGWKTVEYLLVGAHMNLQLVLAGVLLLAMRTAVRLPTGLPRVFHPRLLPISIRILSSLVSHLLPRLFLSHLVTSYVALQIVRPGERSTVSRAARVRASFRLVVPQTSIAARGWLFSLLHLAGTVFARSLDLLAADSG